MLSIATLVLKAERKFSCRQTKGLLLKGWARGWRELHNERLHSFCFSPNIIRMINSWPVIWAGNVACVRDKRSSYNFFGGGGQGNGKEVITWKT
jgi:hypothetical protein